jgi:hypothetical protein
MRLGRRRNYLGETNAQVTERRLNACEENLKDMRLTLNRVQNNIAVLMTPDPVEPEEG